MASRILYNNGLAIDQTLSGGYIALVLRGTGIVRNTGIQNISGAKYFYDTTTFYSGIYVTGDVSLVGNISGNLTPQTDNLYNLGSLANQWANLYVNGTGVIDTLQIDENAVIATGLSVGGSSVVSGIASFKNNITGFSGLYLTGDFIPSGSVIGNLIPKANNAYDLGSASQKWRNSFVSGTGQSDYSVINKDSFVLGNQFIGGNSTITGRSTTLQGSSASSFATTGSGVFGTLYVTGTGIPTTSTGIGTVGQFMFGSGFFYGCTGTNQWGRVALSTF